MLGWLFGMAINFFHGKDQMTETLSTAAEEGKKQIAITFDDGPNPEYTMKLLEGLKKRGVKATFFVLGEEVERYPDILKAAYDDGHLIGVHSYQHVNFGQIGDAAALDPVHIFQADIQKTALLDLPLHQKSLPGTDAAYHSQPKLLSFLFVQDSGQY